MKKLIAGILTVCLSGTALATQPFELTPAQQNAISSFLAEDAMTFLTGGKALVAYKTEIPKAANIKDIAKTYEDNQVAGDLAYFDKRLVINGTIDSINSGIGNRPYLVFKGKQFMGPQAHFDKSKIAEIAQLKKGQEATFVCIGGGAISGIPIFKDCDFTTSLLASMAQETQTEINAFLAGNNSQNYAQEVVVFAMAAASLLPKNNKCSAAGNPCLQQALSLVTNKKNKTKLDALAGDARKQLADAGLKLHERKSKTDVKS